MISLQELYYLVGILAAISVFLGFLWKIARKLAIIEEQVTNHLPSLIAEVKQGLVKLEDRVERFINGTE